MPTKHVINENKGTKENNEENEPRSKHRQAVDSVLERYADEIVASYRKKKKGARALRTLREAVETGTVATSEKPEQDNAPQPAKKRRVKPPPRRRAAKRVQDIKVEKAKEEVIAQSTVAIPESPLKNVMTEDIPPLQTTRLVPPSEYTDSVPTPPTAPIVPVAATTNNPSPPRSGVEPSRPGRPEDSTPDSGGESGRNVRRDPSHCILVTSHMVKSGDIGYHGNLFGGTMLAWLDEAAACLACQVCDSHRMVTLKIDELIFRHPVKPGQVIKIYGSIENIGKTSVTLRMEVRSHRAYDGRQKVVLSTKMTFVRIDMSGESVEINDIVREKWGFKRIHNV